MRIFFELLVSLNIELELERKVYTSTRRQNEGGEPYLNIFNTAKVGGANSSVKLA